MSEWQTIETRPSEGFYLVCCMLGHSEDYFPAVVWQDETISTGFLTGWSQGDEWVEYELTATHWMPLPEPPK